MHTLAAVMAPSWVEQGDCTEVTSSRSVCHTFKHQPLVLSSGFGLKMLPTVLMPSLEEKKDDLMNTVDSGDYSWMA